MSLFADTEPDWPPPRPRRVGFGWTLLVIAILGVVVASLLPAPYVVEKPGPVFDTLSTVQSETGEVPLIDIPGTATYPTAGTLDMLTVNVSGNREQPPSWFEIAGAWLDPSKAVLPVDEVYPAGVTVEQSSEQSRIDMLNSQQEAIAAALEDLGYKFSTTLTIATTAAGSPAASVLQKGDVIKSVNGKSFRDVDALRAAVAANGADAPASVTVLRDGAQRTFRITPVLSTSSSPPTPILGIVVGASYDFPVKVKIQLENVGGPSAGMMFALGIIDKLTPGELNGGERVAGTGTITATGKVGPIGGIRQKLYGALYAGADWFLAPKDNCDEVVGHFPEGLSVYAVGTLEEAITALAAIDSGKGRAQLPTCSAP